MAGRTGIVRLLQTNIGATQMANNTEFKIESGIELAKIRRAQREPVVMKRYPFKQLKIGQSFFVPGGDINRLTNAYTIASKITGARYTARSVTENGIDGVRVWRTANKGEQSPANIPQRGRRKSAIYVDK